MLLIPPQECYQLKNGCSSHTPFRKIEVLQLTYSPRFQGMIVGFG
jgi:hypothetical protein